MFEIPTTSNCTFACLSCPSDWDPVRQWHHRILLTPRTLSEWRSVCQDLKRISLFSDTSEQVCVFAKPPHVDQFLSDGTLHPWYGRSFAATFIEDAVQKTQRIRWILRKAVTRFLVAKARTRTMGETMDLVTTDPIPKSQQVVVCDITMRTTYVFHTQTINRSIRQALLHGLYGIPDAQTPRNPYTNIQWTIGQLTSIFTQIQVNMAISRNRSVCEMLHTFRRCAYDVNTFAEQSNTFLRLVVARSFFRDPTNHEWRLVYHEMLEDIFVCLKLNPHAYNIVNRILDRRLTTELVTEWDDVVFGYWFFSNYESIPVQVATSFMDLVMKIRRLHLDTRIVLEAERPPIVRAKRRRHVEPKNTETSAEESS